MLGIVIVQRTHEPLERDTSALGEHHNSLPGFQWQGGQTVHQRLPQLVELTKGDMRVFVAVTVLTVHRESIAFLHGGRIFGEAQIQSIGVDPLPIENMRDDLDDSPAATPAGCMRSSSATFNKLTKLDWHRREKIDDSELGSTGIRDSEHMVIFGWRTNRVPGRTIVSHECGCCDGSASQPDHAHPIHRGPAAGLTGSPVFDVRVRREPRVRHATRMLPVIIPDCGSNLQLSPYPVG